MKIHPISNEIVLIFEESQIKFISNILINFVTPISHGFDNASRLSVAVLGGWGFLFGKFSRTLRGGGLYIWGGGLYIWGGDNKRPTWEVQKGRLTAISASTKGRGQLTTGGNFSRGREAENGGKLPSWQTGHPHVLAELARAVPGDAEYLLPVIETVSSNPNPVSSITRGTLWPRAGSPSTPRGTRGSGCRLGC